VQCSADVVLRPPLLRDVWIVDVLPNLANSSGDYSSGGRLPLPDLHAPCEVALSKVLENGGAQSRSREKRFYSQGFYSSEQAEIGCSCPGRFVTRNQCLFSDTRPGSKKLPSLEKEPPLCLLHGKLPDLTLKPVTAT
jgi:hypothetical protein